ncbi:hypothetical protein CHUAL_005277 [Chamberlinius hualienensis]
MAAHKEENKLLNISSSSSESGSKKHYPGIINIGEIPKKSLHDVTGSPSYTNNAGGPVTSSEKFSLSSIESQKSENSQDFATKRIVCLISIIIIIFITLFVTVIITTIYVLVNLQQTPEPEQISINYSNSNKQIPMSSFANVDVISERKTPAFLKQPKDVTTSEGLSITLECTFDSGVMCYWLRNDDIIKNDDRYAYNSNTPTTDCSIKISGVEYIDFAIWKCGYIDGNDNELISDSVLVTEALKFFENLEDKQVSLGDDVVFDCKFNAPVTCSWLRDHNVVTINGRYSYVDDGNEPKRDCSLKIKNVKDIDIDTWSCGGTADTEPNQFVIRNMRLTLNDEASLDESPKPISGKSGETITLECQWHEQVTCAWLRNDNHVDISGRYSYNSKKQPENDCSITITNLQSNDEGTWSCRTMGDSISDGTLIDKFKVSIN